MFGRTRWSSGALALVSLLAFHACAQAAPLSERIGHTDPTKYRHLAAVHNGPGTMDFSAILGAGALSTNLIF
ncbi:MAG TPA: hypothetical protein VNT42_08755, partial [Sphingomonas sp.]|nr:hypothetical protein [Sphingomonas sp.]